MAGNSLLFVGQQTTPSGVAAIIHSLIPILTTLFADLLLPSERLTRTGVAGVGLGLVGVAIIARPALGNLLGADVVGKGFVLLAAASVALGSVLLRRVSPGMNDSGLTGWAMVVGGVLLHAGSLAAGEPFPTALPPSVLAAVAYLSVLATAVASLIYFALLAAHGPLYSDLVSYLVPVVATVAGAVLLGKVITPVTVLGFLVIFAGFLLVQGRAIAGLLARRGVGVSVASLARHPLSRRSDADRDAPRQGPRARP